jgi:RNA polymerase sigma-70 factor, ECF subfamily
MLTLAARLGSEHISAGHTTHHAHVWRPQLLPGILNCTNETDVAVDDERSVLGQVARGDKNAFAGLYDRHVPLVYGIAKRITGNPAQAEDITQSVFTMLWAKPDSFAGGNFAAWIARVARNASLDVVRSAAVRTREPEMPVDIPSDNDLEDEVFTRLQSSAVAQALRTLPDDQREAIEQAYFQGLSYSEVAARLGAPLGTVKSRIRTGLRRLWQALQRQVVA